MPTETIDVGIYSFVVTENKMEYNDTIMSHTFKIGGTYDDCISVSYTYNKNKPVSAKLMFVQYEPECSKKKNLKKSGGTAIMLKALLEYVLKRIPSVTKITFEDMSHIDCEEKDLSKEPPRKLTKPLSLAYLSIAYNSCTWYEKYFGAKMSDEKRYKAYKDALGFLKEEEAKEDFISFLQIAQPPKEQIEFLKPLYESSKTYRKFFEAIPFEKRCELLRPWLKTFIEHYLASYYSNYNWEIDMTSIPLDRGSNGGGDGGSGKGQRRKRGATRKQSSQKGLDFPANYSIVSYNEMHSF